MAWSYIDSTLDYLKATLDVIKSSMSTAKDILVAIGNIIGTIVEILGFIGFRVFILLVTTAFVLWLLNLVSPISRKTNYVIAVGLVLWLAITAKMPVQIVVLKYVLIIISPFIITTVANFLVKNLGIIGKITMNRLRIVFARIGFSLFRKNLNKINYGDTIGIVFTSDLPTIDDINRSKMFFESLDYRPLVIEEEKISLVDDDKKIVFSNDLKVSQLLKSLESKDAKLLWFWSNDYSADSIINGINKIKPLKQNKYVIGCAENSFVLNFLQEKWNWKVIYGYNLKKFIEKHSLNEKPEKNIVENIFNSRAHSLSIINDYIIENNYFLKEKIIGSDLSVLVDSIGTNNSLTFKNRILFLDGEYDNKAIFYRSLNHLKNYMLDNSVYPKSIVFGDILLKDGLSVAEVINDFNISLKENNINIPFFKLKNFEFIELGGQCTIEYKNSSISLTSYGK